MVIQAQWIACAGWRPNSRHFWDLEMYFFSNKRVCWSPGLWAWVTKSKLPEQEDKETLLQIRLENNVLFHLYHLLAGYFLPWWADGRRRGPGSLMRGWVGNFSKQNHVDIEGDMEKTGPLGRGHLGCKAWSFLSIVRMRKCRHRASLMRPSCVLPELATHIADFKKAFCQHICTEFM